MKKTILSLVGVVGGFVGMMGFITPTSANEPYQYPVAVFADINVLNITGTIDSNATPQYNTPADNLNFHQRGFIVQAADNTAFVTAHPVDYGVPVVLLENTTASGVGLAAEVVGDTHSYRPVWFWS